MQFFSEDNAVWAEKKGYEYQGYPTSVFGLVLGCIEAKSVEYQYSDKI